ncbi:matrixin family metalloprotease [Hyphomicrobium sp. LHD-15]|uniref:matrixin family metalloprotease n=1 Tax=Hyphomicrobium sp. LHD-15 TaxID=3072142 RepID=UPI0028101CB4|nr:matrixin family metalloprotease [Hyphomicrobium sp. LHD-15]MDQ8697666.1 matrixin family metalloprotease [Hyphomicrobium sp. LHD-15]
MRGSVLIGCTLLAVALAAGASRADDTTSRSVPEFRLLVIGGQKARWTIPAGGLPTTITYAFLKERSEFPGARNCDAMLPPEAALSRSSIAMSDFRSEVRAAFSAWEQAANIVFKETSSISEAGILIGADAKARGRAFTNVALHKKGAATNVPEAGATDAIRQSLICLNPEKPWKIGFNGNLDVYDLRFTVTHEIGHAIGLDHPSPEGQLMSFRYVEKGRGLQAGDIAGAVALYGRKGVGPSQPPETDRAEAAPPPALAGASAFGLGENAGPDR